MSVAYVSYNWEVNPVQPFTEILIAQLAQVGFDTFTETDTGCVAYIPQELDRKDLFDTIQILGSDEVTLSRKREQHEPTNWNQEWESNFDPIEVDGRVGIRAPFHAPGNLEYELTIVPKMSFGTGHHETTQMMVRWLLEMDLAGKRVMDMGAGTGILAILAGRLGASYLEAWDIDEWCKDNAIENAATNGVTIRVEQGTVLDVDTGGYDLWIANINTNILLHDLPHYAPRIKAKGVLLLSGFYEQDVNKLVDLAKTLDLQLAGMKEEGPWRSLKFIKA